MMVFEFDKAELLLPLVAGWIAVDFSSS